MDADARIQQRLDRSRKALDRSLDDLKAVMRRIDKHRARIGRLEGALAIPAADRSARARKALQTRQAPRPHLRRGIRWSSISE